MTLSEAAKELFCPECIADEFLSIDEGSPFRALLVLAYISFSAGLCVEDPNASASALEAAEVWPAAKITDRLQEAEALAAPLHTWDDCGVVMPEDGSDLNDAMGEDDHLLDEAPLMGSGPPAGDYRLEYY